MSECLAFIPYVCVYGICGMLMGQKRAEAPRELESQAVVELDAGPLEEQPGLLTTEPWLQPQLWFFKSFPAQFQKIQSSV